MARRGYSNSVRSANFGRHDKVALKYEADTLAELKSQKDDTKNYVNNTISGLKHEIQGVNISVWN